MSFELVDLGEMGYGHQFVVVSQNLDLFEMVAETSYVLKVEQMAQMGEEL